MRWPPFSESKVEGERDGHLSFLFKDYDEMATSPCCLNGKGRGDGMATSPFYLKWKGEWSGMVTWGTCLPRPLGWGGLPSLPGQEGQGGGGRLGKNQKNQKKQKKQKNKEKNHPNHCFCKFSGLLGMKKPSFPKENEGFLKPKSPKPYKNQGFCNSNLCFLCFLPFLSFLSF